FAELVLDHGDAVPVLLLQDAVEERGLAAPQESREDRDRHHVFFSGHNRIEPAPRLGPAMREFGAEAPGAEAPKKARILHHCRVERRNVHRRSSNSPFRYSPSGNSTSTGWSGADQRRSRSSTDARASAAAPATIFWKSSGETPPEHENVASSPPGRSRRRAFMLMSL